MAKLLPLLIVGLALLAGCQQPAMIHSLPAPNFSPPMLSRGDAPPVIPPAPPGKGPQAIPKKPPAVTGVPREWIPQVPQRNWQFIVIHHSDTPRGGAGAFDRAHKARGWDGLGYDFVIGNGTDTADGQIEVGFRWKEQREGAHTKTPDNGFNETGIGICLVGNFDLDRPTRAQIQSLTKLTAYLMKTYRIPTSRILGHRDCKSTNCPGRNMDVAAFRRTVAAYTQLRAEDDPHPFHTAQADTPAPPAH